jgi:phosphoribosylformimino-5-aminoimidazole carboxamide ribotide isomerase
LAGKEYKGKRVVGIDALNDKVSVDGWTSSSDQNAIGLAMIMKDMGVSSIVYTDISKDGTLEGPNIIALKEMILKTGLDVVASGGIKDIDDIEEVKKTGAYAVITGKAIYEGKISLESLFK